MTLVAGKGDGSVVHRLSKAARWRLTLCSVIAPAPEPRALSTPSKPLRGTTSGFAELIARMPISIQAM